MHALKWTVYYFACIISVAIVQSARGLYRAPIVSLIFSLVVLLYVFILVLYAVTNGSGAENCSALVRLGAL